MKSGKLSEETIKRLRVPAEGNSITYFAGVISKARKPHGVSASASQQAAPARSS